MLYQLSDPSKAAPLFAAWEDLDASISACLDHVMGQVLADDSERPKSAMAVIGGFAYCAGEPDPELVRAAADPALLRSAEDPETAGSAADRQLLLVPQNDAWAAMIENSFAANKRIRYGIKKETRFDRKKLEAMAAALPQGYAFRKIDAELYELCLEDERFEDCVRVFGSKERYLALGRGFAVMKDGKIAAAASSYSRYLKGIDIVIATAGEERRKGLGTAVAAKLILACLDEGLYPAWDASNRMSVRLAEKLGYEYSREYVCFSIE